MSSLVARGTSSAATESRAAQKAVADLVGLASRPAAQAAIRKAGGVRRLQTLLQTADESVVSNAVLVLKTMNPRYAAVLRMRLLEDRDRHACAEALDVKLGTLDVLLFRACKAFRTACERQGVPLDMELR